VVSAAALSALSRLLPTLHLADWTNKEAVVNTLHNTLLDSSSSSSSSGSNALAAAAVEAAGFVGVTLLRQHSDSGLFQTGGAAGQQGLAGGGDRGLALGCSCLGLLLSCFTAVCGAADSSSRQVAAAVVAKLPHSCRDLVMIQDLGLSGELLQNPDLAVAAVKGCCCVLAALHDRLAAARGGGEGAAAAAAVFAQHVLFKLSAVTTSSSSSTAVCNAAVVAAAPAAAATALYAGVFGGEQQQQLAAIAAQLQGLATGSSSGRAAAAVVDVRVCGAAAVSWCQLVVMQLAAAGPGGGGQQQQQQVKRGGEGVGEERGCACSGCVCVWGGGCSTQQAWQQGVVLLPERAWLAACRSWVVAAAVFVWGGGYADWTAGGSDILALVNKVGHPVSPILILWAFPLMMGLQPNHAFQSRV